MSMSRKAQKKASEPPPLPKGFETVEDVLDGEVRVGKLINICGVVKDCRAPIRTHGKDYKMTVTIFDLSTQDDQRDISVNIFRPESQIPHFNAGDVLLALNVKVISASKSAQLSFDSNGHSGPKHETDEFSAQVQEYRGNISIIGHNSSVFHVYSGILMPKSSDRRSVLQALKTIPATRGRSPCDKEHEYVLYMYHNLDQGYIPDQDSFRAAATMSLNVKDKFSTLGNIKEGKFYDIIVQFVKDPYDCFGTLTCYVTDYTTNGGFFHHNANGSGRESGERDSDRYGYTTKFQTNKAESASFWPGPYGQMSMQMTCWEPHADYIRENRIGAGTWVRLQNVQIKFGKNGSHLEGFLRSDQKYPERINVEILEVNENTDSRLKEALRRKRDYEKTNKRKNLHDHNTRPAQQSQAQQGPDHTLGKEQIQEETTAETSKQRRKKLRAEKARAADIEKRRKDEEALGLNEAVKCENFSQETSPISKLLEPIYYEANINGQVVRIQLPFTNVNYRTNVRVVDFHPERLEDFSVCRPKSRYNGAISDSGSSDSDSDSDELTSTSEVWEWRFSLLVEDAMASKNTGKRPEERVWVLVDNFQAQCLSLDDAVDLRNNKDVLLALREKMFNLWGNLEELKQSRRESCWNAAKDQKQLIMPPLSSECNNTPDAEIVTSLRNKPFSCCIKQYGVKVKTNDPSEADAGRGMKWVRIFGLFGTKICT